MVIFKNNNYNNNKQNTYNRRNTYRGRKKNNNTYLLHPNYEKTTLSNMPLLVLMNVMFTLHIRQGSLFIVWM